MARTYQRRRRGLPRIELRGSRYYVTLDVPKDARKTVGKTRFVQSLDTSSPGVAERRAGPFLAAWRKQITEARGAVPADDDDAEFFRRALRRAKTGSERETILDSVGEEAAWRAIEAADDDNPLGDNKAAADFFTAATAIPFADYLDEWLATTRTTAKTKDMQTADVKRFAVVFPTVAGVTKPAVKKWVDGLMADGLTLKTVQRVLSALRGYWKHLQAIEAVPADLEPFIKLNLARSGGRVSRDDIRQAFSPADVVKLIAAARARKYKRKANDNTLADIIEFDSWTGCRIEEVCSLKVEDVHLAAPIPYFTVIEAKTQAGVREVPIHAHLLPLMQRLVSDRKTGNLFPHLGKNKYEARSGAIGTRFGRLKTAAGFDKRFVFHSIRKTVASILKDASVPEPTTADILGHELRTMSYGVYAASVSLKTKAAALAKLSYPDAGEAEQSA